MIYMMSNFINNPQVKTQYNNKKVDFILFQNMRFCNSFV